MCTSHGKVRNYFMEVLDMAGLPVTSLQFSTLPTQALPNVTINLPVPIAASPSIMQLTCAAALAKVGEELDKIDLQNLLKNTNNQESNIQHIPDIIKAINSDNKEFAETICKDDGLSTESNIQHNSDIIKTANGVLKKK